jgi:EAL domain-containing protein (putative c-di-GMP-specific phosphodiesterase class I)
VALFNYSMRARLVERLEITNGFSGSLERSEFFLQYQPIYTLADGQLQGFEALVRWRHPRRGVVPPLSFIPIAEETGFIIPLGRWILIEACEELARSTLGRGRPKTMAINLSRRQLSTPSLVDDIQGALTLSGIAPDQLILEVTESVLMDDPERSAEALSRLRSLGIRIAVDDFGTGYSSLSHLQDFPVDVLKIDKSFIDPLNYDEPLGDVMATTIINLARNLGLEVIAEGIEHRAQLDRLIALGCASGQGFLMSRPVDGADLESFIDNHAGHPT